MRYHQTIWVSLNLYACYDKLIKHLLLQSMCVCVIWGYLYDHLH